MTQEELQEVNEVLTKEEIEKAICNKCHKGMIYYHDHLWYCPYKDCLEYKKVKK